MRPRVLCVILFVCISLSACTSFGGGSLRRDIAAEYYAIAEGYAGLSKYDKAIFYYRKASSVKEYANASNYGLGRMYALSGKWQEACDVLSQLYEKDSENVFVSTSYAFALASNGKKEQAVGVYESVWKKNMQDGQVGRNYAGILVVAGKYTEALTQIALLKEKYPDSDAVKGLDDLEKKAREGLAPPEASTALTVDPKTAPAASAGTENSSDKKGLTPTPEEKKPI